MEYRCRHDINWQMLDYCQEQPKSLSEIFRDLHLKYPLIYKHIRGLTTIEALDALNQDGSQAFEGKHQFELFNKSDAELKELKSAYHRFDMRDYYYQTTQLGQILLEHQKFFLDGIMAEPIKVLAKTLLAPKTTPKQRWKKSKVSPIKAKQIVLLRRLI